MIPTPSDTQPARGTEAVSAAALRSVCGHFATGVTVVTSGRAAAAAGTTVNSFTSVSLEPPLVLFCLHNRSRLRALVEETGAYAVNLLTSQQAALARAFASGETADLRDVPHRPSATGVPVLADALAHLSCRLVNGFACGDHMVFVGEVLEATEATEVPEVPEAPEATEATAREPLVFFRGELGSFRRTP